LEYINRKQLLQSDSQGIL